MKLEEYIVKVANEFPDIEVVYSIDDKGNAFHKAVFNPTYSTIELSNEEWVEAVCVN